MTVSEKFLVLGAALVAAAIGCTDAPSAPVDKPDEPDGIVWAAGSFDEAVQLAGRDDRFLLVYAMAGWCGWCRRMSQNTWSDPDVIGWVNRNTVAFQWDIDSPALTPEMKHMMAVAAVPTVVVFASGTEVARKVGYAAPAEYLKWFESLTGEAQP